MQVANKQTHWYDRTFNARGALGGLLIGLGVGIIPAVLLGASNSWWPSILAWSICAVIGIAIGLIFTKPAYPTELAATSDAITYKKFALYLLIIVLLYFIFVTLRLWLDKKTAFASTIVFGIIWISVRAYMNQIKKVR
jgi:hypothetical protein